MFHATDFICMSKVCQAKLCGDDKKNLYLLSKRQHLLKVQELWFIAFKK